MCRRRGKSSAKVHSTNLVVLASSSPQEEDSELEMGNKSSGFSPTEKQKGKTANLRGMPVN